MFWRRIGILGCCCLQPAWGNIFSFLPWIIQSFARRRGDVPSALKDNKDQPILLLDVDNTLYEESLYGIERQILSNIHSFCADVCDLSAEQADDLHHQHGSTIQGLIDQKLIRQKDVQRFYEQVYRNVSVASLLLEECTASTTSSSCTGYSHSQRALKDLVRDVLTISNVRIASNSPTYHVEKVLQALGLTRVGWDAVYTPSALNKYATKGRPKAFFRHLLLDQHYNNPLQLHLVEDSHTNILACQEWMQTYRVDDKQSLLTALCRALGWIDSNYTFSQVDYLLEKNKVDFESFNRETYQRLIQEVTARVIASKADELVVADLGAGLLSMLRLLLLGHDDNIMPSLVDSLSNSTATIQYYAYEPNIALKDHCLQILESLGFTLLETIEWQTDTDSLSSVENQELIYQRTIDNTPQLTVHLRFWDFDRHMNRDQATPLLVLGCCFADLVEPTRLVKSILGRFNNANIDDSRDDDMVLYFPITFKGITQLIPSMPHYQDNSCSQPVPSDTSAFAMYSSALQERHGHHLDPDHLIDAVTNYGGKLLHRGTSDWNIDPAIHQYLWETMLYFFATVACPELYRTKWNSTAWIERARTKRATIYVSNEDILMCLPVIGSWRLQEENLSKALLQPVPRKYSEIQFVSPNAVGVASKRAPALQPNQVRIRSLHSLISTGTELKVFSGNFDDAALDVNIKGMTTERMAYPLSYGYCLVGTVVECGEDVKDAHSLLGKLVFTFSPHSSQVVVDREAIQVVPDGVEPIDAIFMPSIETALSLVHDANPRYGESVVVFGQGLIGLLVTAILARSAAPMKDILSSACQGTITTVDTLPARLAASAQMGSHETLLPETLSSADHPRLFDVAIEVSGNSRALQAAIDSTRNGGKIIVGSWYGNADVALKLGIDFHRSHKLIQASQVSDISASLRQTWTKERRFALSWELVKQLKPSRLLTRRVSLDDAQHAYESLRDGKEIAVAFEY